MIHVLYLNIIKTLSSTVRCQVDNIVIKKIYTFHQAH